LTEFDLRAARVARLRQYLEAALPTRDPHLLPDMIRVLAPWAAEGLDVIRLVEPVFRRSGIGSILPGPHDTGRHDSPPNLGGAGELGFDALPDHHRATLWPFRPRIRPDELLSSWLWRVASGIGAPPKRFALDAIGRQLADVDREIDDTAIDRIAFLSGHTPQQLLRATMRADVVADPCDEREHVQRLLLRHGDLVLNKRRSGCTRPIVQYCPVCLGEPDPYLPRGWRFSFQIACFKDGCFLLDSCWNCGALLDPLAQAAPSSVFVCGKCGTPLASAPSLRIDGMVTDQALIYERLHSLVLGIAIARQIIGVHRLSVV